MSRPIRVLANAHDLIERLSEVGAATPAELAAHLGIPRPSIYRLIDGLNAISLTTTGDDGRARLNLRWLHLADAVQAALHEWGQAHKVLEEVAEATGQTAFLSLPTPEAAVCVDWVPGRGIDVLALKPGRSLPFHAGAAGRLAFAYAAAEEQRAFLSTAPFPAFTAATITTATALEADAVKIRKQEWVHSDEDVTVGIGSIGIPVLSAENRLRGCLSLAGLTEDIGSRRDNLVARLMNACDQLR